MDTAEEKGDRNTREILEKEIWKIAFRHSWKQMEAACDLLPLAVTRCKSSQPNSQAFHN